MTRDFKSEDPKPPGRSSRMNWNSSYQSGLIELYFTYISLCEYFVTYSFYKNRNCETLALLSNRDLSENKTMVEIGSTIKTSLYLIRLTGRSFRGALPRLSSPCPLWTRSGELRGGGQLPPTPPQWTSAGRPLASGPEGPRLPPRWGGGPVGEVLVVLEVHEVLHFPVYQSIIINQFFGKPCPGPG